MFVRSLVAAIVLSAAGIAWAAPRPQTAAEVEHLLAYLLASGCQFHRNGEWHDAATAARHLREKYEVMLRRDLITTAESFIERGASRSSMSGQPYLVRCAPTTPVPSGDWFGAELQRHRQPSPR
jgi:Family of unknown function (DUF5329)